MSVVTPSCTSGTKALSTELEEDGIRIALTVVDTPGFGDNIDNEDGCAMFLTFSATDYGLTFSFKLPGNNDISRTSI